MGLSRSPFYDAAPAVLDRGELLARIGAICDEFECYGYRRVGTALRRQGAVVNSKKVCRLMREHDLQPRRRRRYVVTSESDHAKPTFPNLANAIVSDCADQLWVADLAYITIPGGFRLSVPHPRCLVAQGRRLRDQPIDGCLHRSRGLEGGDQNPQPAHRLHSPFGSRIAIRVGDPSCAVDRPSAGRVNGPPRQPV